MLESALTESTSQSQADKQKQKQSKTVTMPSTTHTLMDLVITISIYLPRSTFPALFSLAALILPLSADPQLQKKAYKLLPRLATSQTGILALQDRNLELQSLLLTTASTASAPCRRDRLAAIAVVTEYLPPSALHFIPSILSEVVISAKEVNEKARAAAFDLLVLMAHKMHQGGTIAQSQIPHMPPDAPNAEASLEEFFTIISAGLVGSSPHMVSASITALTRILYEYHAQLRLAVVEDLVTTMALFLTSANREIVRSVLGFVKVAIITLPEAIVKPRLESLVPGLMAWSREHKAQFRAKIKHIIERMIRRFGFEQVDRYCPEDDRKFINNIRKTKERRKRQKATADDENDHDRDGDGDGDEAPPSKRKSRFESEYDQAIYGSDSEDDDATADDRSNSDDHRESRTRTGRRSGAKTYIVEDSDEPLDLLDRKALAHISSSKPVHTPRASSTRKAARVNVDGKLVFGGGANDGDGDGGDDEGGGDPMVVDTDARGGVGAYVDAIRGRDAVRRGRGGRLKFSNKRERNAEGEMNDDGGGGGGGGGGGSGGKTRGLEKSGRDGAKRGSRDGGRAARSGKGTILSRKGGGVNAQKAQRRGLGVGKVGGGGVEKGGRAGARGRR